MKYTLTKEAVQWIISKIKSHTGDKSNPHGVTKAQVGLGNVDNTSDASKHVYEANLYWGGRNIDGEVSPIDAAMSSCHSANRIAFAKPAGIKIEYSTDGGSTYTDYGASDSTKIKLVSGLGTTLTVGKHTTYSDVTTNDRLRITVNASNCGVYTALKTVLINVSTEGAGKCTVTVEKSNKGSEDTWSTVGTYSVSGWSAWNSIPVNCTFGGGTYQKNNWANLRFTFKIGLKGSNTSNSNALQVINLEMYGTTWWGYNSNLAHTGHLYSYDENQNATFPAQVTAERFNGTVSRAMADSDGKWINSTYIKGLSVSGRTITYTKGNGTTGTITTQDTNTTYGVATTSADGLMSASDKSKMDSLRASVYETHSVPITGWTSRTINDTSYVQYSITLTNSYQYPSVKITSYPTGSNPAPTSAELTAFNSLVMYGVDDAGGKTLNLIATAVPSTAFAIMISGRKYS